MTEYVGPEASSKLEWWPLYRLGDTVHVQNHLLFYDQLTEPFSLANAAKFIRDRQTVNEDGLAISEWTVAFSDLEDFARSLSV